jgi:hypothetical protein
MKLTE